MLNRDYEFDTDLENHSLGKGEIYRLHYLNYHRIGEPWSTDTFNIGVIDWPLQPFLLPIGMSREDAFKV